MSTVHFVVAMENDNKSMVPNVSQMLTKTTTFKLNQSLTCADFGIYVATCVICHEQYVGQTSNKFSKRWQRIAVIGTNKIVKLTVTRTRWPCRGTIQKTTAL